MENWKDLFKNEKYNNTLRKNGIVKFKIPSLDVSQCTEFLINTVDGYPKDFESTFYQSVSLLSMEKKRQIDRDLRVMLGPLLKPLFINHKLLSYFFLVKGLGDESILRLHQDWSVIDERKYRAYNLWIPLSKSTKKNGTLYAIKGSHRFPLNIRGAGIPNKISKDDFKLAEKYLTPINVNIGEALIFDSRLLHYSPPNYTNESRTAIINNLIPIEADTMFFHGIKTGGTLEVNRYDVPEDFFMHYDNFNEQKGDPNPKGKLIERIDFGNTSQASTEEFLTLLRSHKIRKKPIFS